MRAARPAKFKMAAGLEYSGTPPASTATSTWCVPASKVALALSTARRWRWWPAATTWSSCWTTPRFYAESGGQAGDSGELRNGGRACVVEDTTKIRPTCLATSGRVVEGSVKVGDAFTAKVDAELRAKDRAQPQRHAFDAQGAARSAGRPRAAKGSLVTADRTRFDFAHNAPDHDDRAGRRPIVNAEIYRQRGARPR